MYYLYLFLKKAKELKGPVLIHTITKKGKGYELAENNPSKFHAISSFDTDSGVTNESSKANYSQVFGEALIEIAKKDKDVVAITAAMPDGTGLRDFFNEFPERFFDVGIAEQHAVTLAAGMACIGIKPVFAVYSTFLQRAYDQVVHDVCIQKLPVVFCIDRAGIVGADGETHQGIMDISFLSMIPNMTIVAPKCLNELKPILDWAINYNEGPVAIRYPRGGDAIQGLAPLNNIDYGKWETINEGQNVAVIATGKMVQSAIIAKDLLSKENVNPSIINATFIKPLDENLLEKLIDENFNIVTVEDNLLNGGFGSMVLQELNKRGFKGKLEILAYKDEFVHQGNVSETYEEYGLDSMGIMKAVMNLRN